MNLPMQSQPVQRSISGTTSAKRLSGAEMEPQAFGNGEGVEASLYGGGVAASGFDWSSLIPIATTVLGSLL
jgi:hypothetical protein